MVLKMKWRDRSVPNRKFEKMMFHSWKLYVITFYHQIYTDRDFWKVANKFFTVNKGKIWFSPLSLHYMQNLFLMSRSSFDNIIRLPYVYIDETWWLQHTIQIITAKIQQFTYEGYILVFVPAGGKLLWHSISLIE